MPGVTVLPSSSALRSIGPLSPVSSSFGGSHDDMSSVVEIKEKAKSSVQRVREASAPSLIKLARDQAVLASTREAEGDLKSAFTASVKAASLSQLVYETAEFKAEQQGKRGALWKDFVEFQQQYGNDLIPRTNKLEAKLTELEKSKNQLNGLSGSASEDGEGPIRKSGGSIADRMRSLQDAGMSVATTKRFARDFSVNPLPPDASRFNAISRTSSSQPGVSSSSPTQSGLASPQLSSHSTGSSSHSFVAPSSFGPPSPTSSSSPSPRLAHFHVSDFAQTFPSIDELDEMGNTSLTSLETLRNLPSVPIAKPGTSIRAPLPSPPTVSRFPSLPLDLDPGPRPASTPITPTTSTSISRPASPSRVRSPTAVLPKNAGLAYSSSKGLPSTVSPMSSGDRPDLPLTSTIFPRTLHGYIDKAEIKVLLLDVRNRDLFEKEHIRSDAVVCLEPYVLTREGLTGEKLEDSLSVAPRHESVLFRNRDKFDLIVMYDEDSQSFGTNSALTSVVRVIFEKAFRKALKKPPVILLGGLKAWKALFGSEGMSVGKQDASTGGVVREMLGSPDAVDDAGARTDKAKYAPLPMSPKAGSQDINGIAPNGLQDIQHEIWTPKMRSRAGTDATPSGGMNGMESSRSRSDGRIQLSMDQILENPRSPPDANGQPYPADPSRRLVRKPALNRPPSTSSIPSYGIRTLYDTISGQSPSQAQYQTSTSSIQYPQFSRTMSASNFTTSFPYPSGQSGLVSPPPQASINSSPLARRRSDYIDQSEQAVSSFSSRQSIDYPDLSAQHVLRPPPAIATPPLERQDNRPRMPSHGHSHTALASGPRPPTIHSDYPISYWPDTQIATSGLKNLGNTCYMNATIQCLSATVPFARFFTDGRWKSAVNMMNPMGTKGHLTQAFSSILHEMWHEELPYLSPYTFRRSICVYAKQFSGSEQHDSQEFLSFLLDGLHEDLNRVLHKAINDVTPEHEAELEVLPQQIASELEWKIYRMRNDSIVVDFFQGQFRNRLECMTCRKTSTTYNAFMYLSLPIPAGRGVTKLTLQQCLDAFVQEEVMEKSDAWNCPNCKTLRKATKKLSLSRLPPILLIHLKRFSFKGPFTDKLETFIDFPLKSLDLTNYMPPPLPPGVDKKQSAPTSLDDPRSQIPPYRYDLYGVTNHFGTLSSGHYTAFVNSRGSWMYCDDSRITPTDAKEVVGRPAYVLFYKRSKT